MNKTTAAAQFVNMNPRNIAIFGEAYVCRQNNYSN